MIPHKQTILGKGEEAAARGEEPGDCLRTCVASILDRELHHVPNFVHTGEDPYGLWHMALDGWLYKHGWRLRCYRFPSADADLVPAVAWTILGGPGPRGHRHVVVGRGLEPVHDPHPSDDGLLSVDSVWVFVACRIVDQVAAGVVPDGPTREETNE